MIFVPYFLLYLNLMKYFQALWPQTLIKIIDNEPIKSIN